MNINLVAISGRITANPELRKLQSGTSVISFTVAVDSHSKDENGKREAFFIPCVAWNAQADYIAKYAMKGSVIIIDGYLQQSVYTRKDGAQQNMIQVICKNISLPYTAKPSETVSAPSNMVQFVEPGSQPQTTPVSEPHVETVSIEDDDLPY